MNYKNIWIMAGAVMLTACGGGDSSSVDVVSTGPAQVDTSAQTPSRIIFDPSAGVLPLPSDLLFSGTLDGTLEMPDETAAKDAGGTPDFSDPAVALGALDGWSTQMPMTISVALEDGASINSETLNATSVYMVEAIVPPLDGSAGDCQISGVSVGSPCGVARVLQWGVDYIAVASESSISVVPLKPLEASTTYVVGLASGISDSRGELIQGSATYQGATLNDVDIQLDGLDGLQDAINLYEAVLAIAAGADPANAEDMIYSSAWTTVSIGDAVRASVSAITAQTLMPTITGIAPHPAGSTTSDFNPALGGVADVYLGSVSLPYFSAVPTTANPTAPVNDDWEALCDSGVILAGADQDTLASLTPGENAQTCAALGLADFENLDTERHLTRYNPVAKTRSIDTLDVLITVPNALSGNGANTWPVVMYQHGITSNKESVLAFADTMALAGFATVSIDLPLHGSRGFDLDSDGTDDINASSVDVTHFMNLASLLSARDNLRQSFADMLGVRLAIANGMAFDDSASISQDNFDRSQVHFVGMSLGGITGTGFTALAADLGVNVDSAAIVVGGGGIIPLLMDSGSFGSLIQTTVLQGAGLDPSSVDAATAASVLGQFAFAAQTIVDSGDPNNYAASAAATPLYVNQVTGDAVIPNQSTFAGLTFGGTTPLAGLLGVSQVSFGDTPQSSGFVKFSQGSHSSFLDPTASAATTVEMQQQVATFLAAGLVVVTDAGVVE